MNNGATPHRSINEHFSAIRIAAIYALFSLLWIVFSDRILRSFVQDPDRLTEMQTYKGWLFVLASAAVIYSFLLREFRKIKRAQQQLVESEQNARDLSGQAAETQKKLQLLLDSTAEGILGVDLEGENIFINRAACDLIGLDQQKMSNGTLKRFLNQIVIDGTGMLQKGCVVDRVITTNKPFHKEKGCLETKDGSVVDIEYRAHPIDDESGQAIGAVITFTDITEKLRLQAIQLRNSQFAALGEVTAGVAHEINNPINGVINYTQILLNRRDESDQDFEILERIVREGQRIAGIVKNLLNFSRQEPTKKEDIEIRSILLEPLNLMAMQFKNDGIHVEMDFEDELPRIHGNTMQLEQVVINLFSNARHALNKKFAENSGNKMLHVEARSCRKNGKSYVELQVWDNGCGIPKENLEKVVNPFFTTKEAGTGTGIGLSLANEILTRHQAELFLESKVDQFTRVTLRFPAAAPS